jgi:hypothetical protein
MRQGRFRRIAAGLVFLSVALVAEETPAIGLEQPGLPIPVAAEAPAVSTLVDSPVSLPTLPSLSTPPLAVLPGVSTPPSALGSSVASQKPSGSPSLVSTRSSATGGGQVPPSKAPTGLSMAASPSKPVHGGVVNYEARARFAAYHKRGRHFVKVRARRRADTRRLRAAVGRLKGCFYALSRRERRVIVLRAGLNGRRPHLRSQVARRMNISQRDVRRTERRALRRLRVTARRDGCAAGADDGRTHAASQTRLVGLVEKAAASQPIGSRIPTQSLGLSAPSDLYRQTLPDEPPPRSQRVPGLARGSGGSGDDWVVVAASWGMALLLIMFLIGFFGGLIRVRRQK